MVSVSGKDEGIIYFPPPYPDGRRYCTCHRKERSLENLALLYLIDHIRDMNTVKDILRDRFQLKGRRGLERVESVIQEDIILVQDSSECLGKIPQSFPILVMEEYASPLHHLISRLAHSLQQASDVITQYIVIVTAFQDSISLPLAYLFRVLFHQPANSLIVLRFE
jgi:hypothetical protein